MPPKLPSKTPESSAHFLTHLPAACRTESHCPGQNLLSPGTELGGSIDMDGRVE